jgi:hypothetical protein
MIRVDSAKPCHPLQVRFSLRPSKSGRPFRARRPRVHLRVANEPDHPLRGVAGERPSGTTAVDPKALDLRAFPRILSPAFSRLSICLEAAWLPRTAERDQQSSAVVDSVLSIRTTALLLPQRYYPYRYGGQYYRHRSIVMAAGSTTDSSKADVLGRLDGLKTPGQGDFLPLARARRGSPNSALSNHQIRDEFFALRLRPNHQRSDVARREDHGPDHHRYRVAEAPDGGDRR